MKIEKNDLFNQQVQNEKPFDKASVTTSFSETVKAKTDALEQSVRTGLTGYSKEEVKAKSAMEELEAKIGNQMDAAMRKNQMAVLSNTMTPEDYKRAQEEGFSLSSTDGQTLVTVTDKIKAQLAKAGVDVSHMGGSLTKEQFEEIAGSLAAAAQLEHSFESAALPVTEENMTEGMEAWKQAEELTPLSRGAVKYMLDNRLAPSIANLFTAEFSGSAAYAPAEEEIDFEALRGQMEQVITAAGKTVNEQTIADSKWMIQSGIAYTAENFSYMQKLLDLQLPAEGSVTAAAIAAAVAEGDRPKDAMLLREYSITAQAEHAVEVVTEASDEDIAYLVSNRMELTVENLERAAALRRQGALDPNAAKEVIEEGSAAAAEGSGGQEAKAVSDQGLAFLKAKRILEETRLAMTTEANRALLKQGISIDTKPLEELVEQLKEQEQNYYAKLLGENGKADAISMAALFEETEQKVSDLKQMPAYLLGMKEYSLDTVTKLHEAGTVLKGAMERAGESYEALMTEPRKDLGDSIQKAFSNVNDILEDLGMEQSEANRRAVRILAYNSLEITKESVLSMKAADERVQRTFSNLTPAAVRELIGQGENPLDLPLDELNQKVEAIRQEGAETERFSEYLWKLEQNGGITPEEKESFIGIYRLIHQIEKTDGAAIGALVSQGAEFTMRNLLTAVRSAKKSGMDYTVDDSFGGIDAAETKTKSITDQIETAYQADCMKDVMETLTPVTMQKLLQNPDWENYTPEQLKAALEEYAEETSAKEEALDISYAESQLEELKQAAAADEEVYQLLERYQLPDTTEHILAANRMVNRRNQVFSKMFNSDEVFSGGPIDFAAIREEILGRFAEALKTPEEMAAAQEALADTAERVMKTMIADKEHITSMDIRELKLMNTQISIAGKMADNEEYTIPVLVGGDVTNISLKIVRGTEKKGMVEILFETDRAGKVAARLEAKEEGVSGFAATDNKEMQQMLEQHIQDITKEFEEEKSDLQVTYVSKLNFSRFSDHYKPKETAREADEETYQVQTARLYKIAKGFLEGIKKLSF